MNHDESTAGPVEDKHHALVVSHHPAFAAALINSEARDDSEVSFSEQDRAAYRRHSGRDIPDEGVSKSGVLWQSLKEFPADRVIPDDHPPLQYYRWFWTVGDGWNGPHSPCTAAEIDRPESWIAPRSNVRSRSEPRLKWLVQRIEGDAEGNTRFVVSLGP